MFIRHEYERGSALGREFTNHVLEVTHEEAADLMGNPHWRALTEFEEHAYRQMRKPEESLSTEKEVEPSETARRKPRS